MEFQYDMIEFLFSDASEEINGKNSFDETAKMRKKIKCGPFEVS